MSVENKKDNQYLLEKQLETLKIFLQNGVITKELYEYEVKVLSEKVKVDKNRD